MYGTDSTFWLGMFIVLAVFVVTTAIFNAIMRKRLGIKKTKAFSLDHVNGRHKKIDWGIRIFFIVAMIVGSTINITRLPLEPYSFLEPWFLLIVLIFSSEIVRAVIERKYAENPNAYIYTLSQLSIIAVFLVLIFTTDFFGFL